MKILFITASRIGDAVLSTGLLHNIEQRYPKAKVTIVCGPLCASLFAGYPLLDEVIGLKKEKNHGHWFKLWRRVIGTKWDMVIDLRNSAVSRLIFARERHIFGKHIDKALHKAQQNAAVMGLEKTPNLKLWFTPSQVQIAEQFIPKDGTPVIGVGPSANWPAKTWPAERFIEVIKVITAPGGRYENARVAVFAAPGEEAAAKQVLVSIPLDRRIDVIAKVDPGTAAATIARCDFYIGNDSGLMHCAAAAGVKTLGLFGPSYPHLYRPWGAETRYVSTPESFDELISYEGYSAKTAPCLMKSLSVEAVLNKIH